MKSCAVLALIGMFFSCVCSANDTTIPLLSIKGVNWTNQEVTYIKALQQKGSIKIATKVSTAVYMPHEDGSNTGFHYSVLKEFTDLARVDLDVQLVTWSDYFYKNGEDLKRVKMDASYSYVPELIEKVDLYVDGITALTWREKMFDIVKYVPSRQMIVTKKNNKMIKFTDLNNKICAMVDNTSMKNTVELLKARHHINVVYEVAESFDEMDEMVSDGRADYTVYDSDRAFAALSKYKNLTIAWPISDVQMMGWAINKENKVLKGVLEKYIQYAQANGVLDKYWKRSYGVTFVEYMKVLSLGGGQH